MLHKLQALRKSPFTWFAGEGKKLQHSYLVAATPICVCQTHCDCIGLLGSTILYTGHLHIAPSEGRRETTFKDHLFGSATSTSWPRPSFACFIKLPAMVTVDQLKTQANAAYADSDYPKAVRLYTQ